MKVLFCLIMGFSMLVLTFPAKAHWADMAAMELDITGQSAEASLTLPTPFFKTADANHDGTLSASEIGQNLDLIQNTLNQHVHLQVNHKPVNISLKANVGDLPNAAPSQGMSNLQLAWHWHENVQQMSLRYDLFPADAPLAHCLVSLQKGTEMSSLVFDPQHIEQALVEPGFGVQVLSFGLMGLEHILTGYDHLLFLLALLLASSRLKYLLKIVTAFTLAHSLTLSLAVLNLVQVPARWVESLIAASIMYVVAVEVLWKKQETPWYIVSGFGLVHGLGFASILREMSLPTNQLATALISFNLGIEVGQLSVVILLWGALTLLSKKPQWYNPFQTACAMMILLLSGYWFLTRAFLGAA